MMSIVQTAVAVFGGACTLVFLLIGTVAMGFTFSERMQGQQPGLSKIRKNTQIGSLLFIAAASLAALVTKLMVGWVV